MTTTTLDIPRIAQLCNALADEAQVGIAALEMEFVRVEYEIGHTVFGIRTAGLPEEFVEFLQTGGKPASSTSHA